MYHMKKDKRSEKAAEMLYSALLDLLKEKPFGTISVTELSRHSTVSRSTFYRNFDEPVDILLWKCNGHFSAVIRGYITEGSREKLGLLEYVFRYWQTHSEILECLFRINRIDIIYDSFSRNSAPVAAMLREKFDFSEKEIAYLMSIRIGILIGILKVWLAGGKKESAHTLALMLEAQFRHPEQDGIIL